MRYLDGSQGRSGKCITTAELGFHRAHDLAVGFVFETDGRAQTTYADGWGDGQLALLDATYLDLRPGTVIFNAQFDFDVAYPGDYVEYANGFYDALQSYPPGPLKFGIYGGQRIIEHAQVNWPGVVALWQTLAWSQARPLPYVHIFQYATGSTGAGKVCGVDVDLNHCYDESVLTKGADMTEEQVRAIMRDFIANEYGPALEAELQQRFADNSSADVAAAIKAVSQKLAA